MTTVMTGGSGQAMTLNPGSQVGEILIVLPGSATQQVAIGGANTLLGTSFIAPAGKIAFCIWTGSNGWSLGYMS